MLIDEDEPEYSYDLFITYKDANSITEKLLNNKFYHKKDLYRCYKIDGKAIPKWHKINLKIHERITLRIGYTNSRTSKCIINDI